MQTGGLANKLWHITSHPGRLMSAMHTFIKQVWISHTLKWKPPLESCSAWSWRGLEGLIRKNSLIRLVADAWWGRRILRSVRVRTCPNTYTKGEPAILWCQHKRSAGLDESWGPRREIAQGLLCSCHQWRGRFSHTLRYVFFGIQVSLALPITKVCRTQTYSICNEWCPDLREDLAMIAQKRMCLQCREGVHIRICKGRELYTFYEPFIRHHLSLR